MAAELKPCMFCGQKPMVLPRTCDKDTPYNPADRAFPVIRCRCGISLDGEDWKGPESAISKWNALGVAASPAPKLTVWYGPMPESNGRTNWTAILHRGSMHEGFTLARSEYPGRVRYAADEVRFLLGELEKEPHILDYDGDERTPCHLCGGLGQKDGKPCWGLNFQGPVHDADAASAPSQGGEK